MWRRRRQLLILVVAVPVLAGLALLSLRGGASSASTVAPSARPTATAFAAAYVSFVNGRITAGSLPDATATVRSLAASAGRAPARYRGKVTVRDLGFSAVLGARTATGLLHAQAGPHQLEAALALSYTGSHWLVTQLVPPDYSTVFSPPPPRVIVPADLHGAARAFALQYAEYRTGTRPRPPAASPTIARQIAAGQDPLAGAARTRDAPRLLRVQLLPQGGVAVADATVLAGGQRLAFGFILQVDAGVWQPASFPESQP